MVITSLSHSKNFYTDFPITYLIHPRTAIYVGYNTDLANLDPNLGVESVTGAILTTRNGCIHDSRQFFVKRPPYSAFERESCVSIESFN